MDKITAFFNSLVPASFDWFGYFKSLLILASVVLGLALVARLIFGKGSLFNRSLSSSLSVLICCIATVCLDALGADLDFLLARLPFIRITDGYLHIQLHLPHLSTQLLSMVILCFLANHADGWLPEGKGFLGWFFFRCCGVLLAMLLHRTITGILNFLLPDSVLLWAPRILLAALVLMLLLGAMHLLFGGKNRIFRSLHDFFFKNEAGKLVYRAVLTTLVLALLACIFTLLGVSGMYIQFDGLLITLPVLVILLASWFVVGRVL